MRFSLIIPVIAVVFGTLNPMVAISAETVKSMENGEQAVSGMSAASALSGVSLELSETSLQTEEILESCLSLGVNRETREILESLAAKFPAMKLRIVDFSTDEGEKELITNKIGCGGVLINGTKEHFLGTNKYVFERPMGEVFQKQDLIDVITDIAGRKSATSDAGAEQPFSVVAYMNLSTGETESHNEDGIIMTPPEIMKFQKETLAVLEKYQKTYADEMELRVFDMADSIGSDRWITDGVEQSAIFINKADVVELDSEKVVFRFGGFRSFFMEDLEQAMDEALARHKASGAAAKLAVDVYVDSTQDLPSREMDVVDFSFLDGLFDESTNRKSIAKIAGSAVKSAHLGDEEYILASRNLFTFLSNWVAGNSRKATLEIIDFGTNEGYTTARFRGISWTQVEIDGRTSFEIEGKVVEFLYEMGLNYSSEELQLILNSEKLKLAIDQKLSIRLYIDLPEDIRGAACQQSGEVCDHGSLTGEAKVAQASLHDGHEHAEIAVELARGRYVYEVGGVQSAWSFRSNRMVQDILNKVKEKNSGLINLKIVDFGTPEGAAELMATGNIEPRIEINGRSDFRVGDGRVFLNGQLGTHYNGIDLLGALKQAISEQSGRKPSQVLAFINLSGQNHLTEFKSTKIQRTEK
ncbi:MAG: hypothetical protein CVV64_08640 [Candidatus Wallbacteria bacterium HGW-Wallbacteria-1]|jgi:hypothetical protein|uniref:Uncharacterized protein n=1 Tax=Candidatus Wallbacteria bacterium HGW-Wallbacteria-1 TaxID=2013854 RepID=A0A2N1PQ61_9BACT|nr:MAG: hypothetical protein CVV64_08640 [Candidatus Wallbacteria bacterium HGW-Wallbacteria-1]